MTQTLSPAKSPWCWRNRRCCSSTCRTSPPSAKAAEFRDIPEAEFQAKYGWYFRELFARVVPNMQRLQAAFRKAKVEVLYTTIESLTKDGRDRSLDYKISGFNVTKGSWDGKVIDELRPGDDEICLPKSSSSVFVSTHIDYLLRNLGVKQLVISGLITDQCVNSAIRDACDLGYLVTEVTDACLTYSQERHDNSLARDQGLLPPAHHRPGDRGAGVMDKQLAAAERLGPRAAVPR